MKGILTDENIKQIAREYGRTKGAKALSEELGVSRQRIQQFACYFRKLGVNIPKMRREKGTRNKVLQEIAEELKKELNI